jgi:hypothetical protein
MSGKMFNAGEVERIVDGIAEASEEVLAKSHLGRTLAEASAPEGVLEIRRAWREVDAVMGPGKSAMDVMLARYRSLTSTSERMNELLRQGRRARSAAARKVVLAEMDTELRAFRKLKSEIAGRVEQSVDEIRNRLRAEFSDEFRRGRKTISPREAKAECLDALDEFELTLQNQRDALERRIDATPTAAQAEKRAEALVTRLKKTRQTGERAAISSRIKRFAEHKNAQELSIEFSKRLKRRLRRDFPALHDIEDSSLVFMEALGAIDSARPDMARLLRRYAEDGAATLTKAELKRVEGILGQLRGLMPEEVALRMGFCDALFHKAAFELLADIPPELRGQLSVEIVDGPLWVLGPSGPARQFGDGSMLITGPGGQSAIVGLGEVKAGFDEDLLEQLFVRSDKRAIDAKVAFIDREGSTQVRQLTREFKLPGAEKPIALTKPPIYVHSSPADESAEGAAKFKQMLDDQMRSGRELLKVQLPFGTAENARFTEEALREGVKVMKKIRTDWGR